MPFPNVDGVEVDLRPWGYAMGWYMCGPCSSCSEQIEEAAKRTWRCFKCASDLYRASLLVAPEHEGFSINPLSKWRPIEEAIKLAESNGRSIPQSIFGLKRSYNDHWTTWIGLHDPIQGWLICGSDDSLISTDPPTHYQPLPEPYFVADKSK